MDTTGRRDPTRTEKVEGKRRGLQTLLHGLSASVGSYKVGGCLIDSEVSSKNTRGDFFNLPHVGKLCDDSSLFVLGSVMILNVELSSRASRFLRSSPHSIACLSSPSSSPHSAFHSQTTFKGHIYEHTREQETTRFHKLSRCRADILLVSTGPCNNDELFGGHW